jgi:RND family efflux transporter MFP subunit
MVVAQKRLEIAQTVSTQAGLVRAYERAQYERDVALAGVRAETMRAQQATIAVAQAGVESVRVRMKDRELRAPVSGRVVHVESSLGELVRPFDTLFLLEGEHETAYQIEVFVPEVDVARIQLGNTAHVMFDAFGRDAVFSAEVVRIALVETVREGVPTYKTTLLLTEPLASDYVLRPGMTADIDITTTRRTDILRVPTRSVLGAEERRYVRVYQDGAFREREIRAGLRGSDGMTEVLDGLTEGDEVVVYVEEE